jgi:hypothetical protein
MVSGPSSSLPTNRLFQDAQQTIAAFASQFGDYLAPTLWFVFGWSPFDISQAGLSSYCE